jgi:nitrate reductase NapE component
MLTTPTYPQETYVSTSYDGKVVFPYFDIATKYGFANYMFQTNQGPSNPAHQFIFSGTSSAAGNSQQQYYYQDFTAENPDDLTNTGCASAPDNRIKQIDRMARKLGKGDRLVSFLALTIPLCPACSTPVTSVGSTTQL